MAGGDKHSRTEDPTPKRKKEARKEGRVAKSPDVAGWAAVVLACSILPWFFGLAERHVLGVVGQAVRVGTAPSPHAALAVMESGLKTVLVTMIPIGAIFALLAIVANLAQTGRTFSFKAARPKLSHISPKSGIQRMFSPNTGVQLLKQVVKLVVLIGASYQILASLIHELAGKHPVSLVPVIAATASSVLGFVRIIAAAGLAIGIADYIYQRRKLKEGMKMTKQEVKEENKSSEGDPYVKGEVKKRMYTLARSTIIAAVRNADVVVTNPTHYAVALRYESGRGGAPRVVAKGADLLATRIRTEATTYSVPVVEDPPLARYLYAICEVDQPIPAEIYFAVARLLAFVYSLPAVVRNVGVHHPVPSDVPFEPAAMAGLSPSQRERVAGVLSGSGGR